MRGDVLVGGKYRLVRPIGAGGMGTVWLARNEMTEREFAIKFLHAHAAESPKALQRFFQEARVSGKLRHPSILEIFDVGTAPELSNAPYLVMELLDGAPLDGVIRKVGRVPEGVALEIGAAVARAIAVAHEKGIVHRDLKPANVFLHKPGTGAVVPKVLDFGISKIVSQPEAAGPSLGLTQTGAVLGSPLYMSPEQVEGTGALDGRSDVYSLGLVIWECLVGKVPYRATSYNLLVVEKLAPGRPLLREALPDASAALEAILAKAIARDRDARFGSARELADALDAHRAGAGLASVLERTTAAQWLFAQMSVASPVPPPPSPEASTTGAVSVPRPRATPSSPVAYTMGTPPSNEPAAFAKTEMAFDPPPVRAVTAGTTGPAAAGPARAIGSRVALGAGAVVVCAATALVAWRAATPSAPQAASATIAPSPAPSATAHEPEDPATIAIVPTTPPLVAKSTPTPTSTSTPRSTSASTRAAPSPRPHATPAAKDAGASSTPANHGIVDDGL